MLAVPGLTQIGLRRHTPSRRRTRKSLTGICGIGLRAYAACASCVIASCASGSNSVIQRSSASVMPSSNSYRRPRFSVRFCVTRHVSWKNAAVVRVAHRDRRVLADRHLRRNAEHQRREARADVAGREHRRRIRRARERVVERVRRRHVAGRRSSPSRRMARR